MTVDVLPYSYLVETDRLYRFGPLDAPTLVVNGVDGYGCQWMVDEPEGWDAPEAVTPVDERQQGDGGYAGLTTFATRVLSFGAGEPGLTVCPSHSAALDAMRRLRAVCLARSYVVYTQADEPDQSLRLRASGKPKIRWVSGSDVAFEWAFVMVADDPMKYDAAAVPQSTQLPGSGAGYAYPLVYNLKYGAGQVGSGSIIVNNLGDETGQAVYTLHGPVAGQPTVQNTTTGSQFTIARSLLSTDVVVVDTRAATVTLNGGSILSDFRGDFPAIVEGPNLIQWSGSAAGDRLSPGNEGASLTVFAPSTWK